MSSDVIAAGGIVTRTGDCGTEVVVIHRPDHQDWSFPKGKLDPGESIEEAALREVWEETMLRCSLGEYLGTQQYKGKLVHYWTMSVEEEGTLIPNDEVDELRWVPLAEAAELLTHRQDRSLLEGYLALTG